MSTYTPATNRYAAIAAALNAPPRTAGIRDTVYNILDALEEKGLATWCVLSDEDADALRAEARGIILGLLGVATKEPVA